MLAQLGLYILLFSGSEFYYTGVRSMDAYVSTHQLSYSILNWTYFSLLENSLLFGCLYVLKSYPDEFKIKEEVCFSFAVNFTLNFISEFAVNNKGFGRSTTQCVLGSLCANYVLNLLRMVAFVGYLTYITRTSFFYFPLPFAWIFKDLNKFIFEPYCIRIFEAYLHSQEPKSNRC
jgi:hypothetical protein